MKSKCGTDILKGVYNALVLTIRNPEKISKVLSRTKQRRCPVGVLYTYPKYRIAIGVSILMATNGIEVVLYISAWGFCVARFDRMGNSQEPLIVKRATVQGFTLFLCLEVQSFLINLRVAEVLNPTKL